MSCQRLDRQTMMSSHQRKVINETETHKKWWHEPRKWQNLLFTSAVQTPPERIAFDMPLQRLTENRNPHKTPECQTHRVHSKFPRAVGQFSRFESGISFRRKNIRLN